MSVSSTMGTPVDRLNLGQLQFNCGQKSLGEAFLLENRMDGWTIALAIAGLLPVGRALLASRGTSLLYALGWALAAWLMWIAACTTPPEAPFTRFLALCLTAAAGVAVLGARRPQVGPWNFVVVGLLAVLLLPVAESWFRGPFAIDGVRLFFLAATLAVTVLNYVPTRFGSAALLLLISLAGELAALHADTTPAFAKWSRWGVLATPWLAWVLSWTGRHGRNDEFECCWTSFRDRFGFVWAQRTREQFNHACKHAHLSCRLYWNKLVMPADELNVAATRAQALRILQGLLRRFGKTQAGNENEPVQ